MQGLGNAQRTFEECAADPRSGVRTHWVTKVWTGLTIVLKAHGDGLEMAPLQNVLLMTDVGPDSIGVPPAPDPFGR